MIFKARATTIIALLLFCTTLEALIAPAKVGVSTLRSFVRVHSSSSTEQSHSRADACSLLRDCICLVTGASRGIGKGVALQLGKQGATVYITGTSSSVKQKRRSQKFTAATAEAAEGTIEETAAAIDQAGGTGIAVYCNHGQDEDVQALMKRIEADHGRLDILVNNAFRLPAGSVQYLNKKFWEMDLSIWDNVHTVGLRSHYTTTYFAMPLLMAAAEDKSRPIARPLIAMVSSFGGLTYTFNLAYGVGKAGVDRMAKDMAIELDDLDICVVSLWPGVVETERTVASVKSGDWDKYVGVPLDNAESAEFTGKAVVAVATDPNNMIKTGSYQVVAELAQEYGFTDINGTVPPSIRSLRFLLPSYGFDEKLKKSIPPSMIPDWKLPFWLMAGGRPPPAKT